MFVECLRTLRKEHKHFTRADLESDFDNAFYAARESCREADTFLRLQNINSKFESELGGLELDESLDDLILGPLDAFAIDSEAPAASLAILSMGDIIATAKARVRNHLLFQGQAFARSRETID